MFPPLYSTAISALAIAYLPKLLYRREKYSKSLKQRFGRGLPSLPTAPVTWLHAVSVGETRALAPLAQLIDKEGGHEIVVSSVTETGHEEALRLIPQAKAHLFLPLDLKATLHPLLSQLSLRALILSEGDLWWRFMEICRERGAKIALVNGKLSERSLQRMMWCPPLRKRLCSCLNLCCVQNELYADRFRSMGIAKERLHIEGNLKFDIPASNPSTELLLKLSLPTPIPPLLIIGSTHHGEEEQLIRALTPLLYKEPSLRICLAPRHPERFTEVAALLEKKAPFPIKRFSSMKGEPWRLLLIDAMGLLPSLYSLATAAIVGGSFVKEVGGHNVIEPCLAGSPVLFGPHMWAQPDMTTLVSHYESGYQLSSAEEVTEKVGRWLAQPELLSACRSRCAVLTEAVRGATLRTHSILKALY